MEDDKFTQTQLATQEVLDPRRIGRNNSGLSETDIADVLCILHPCSLAAFRIVKLTAERSPQHVLPNHTLHTFDDAGQLLDPEEQETLIVNSDNSTQPQGLALRFSSRTVQPILGFCFGRNARLCDVVLETDTVKRVSNLHFRIFVNNAGVIMLQDTSTNGTLVDDVHLRGKTAQGSAMRMLNSGSFIQILSPREEEIIKFIVSMPSREGYEDEFSRKFQAYMAQIAMEEQRVAAKQAQALAGGAVPPSNIAASGSAVRVPILTSKHTYGMHWNGGHEYNVVGLLGKGAFATVYKLVTAMHGQPLAAKELEKKRFIKNGQLDQRLDNEMQIMKTLTHPNIVQYMDYHDVGNHLYIIMEFVPCGDLQGYLANHGVLSEASAKLMARQILGALAYLHQKKITHRDIKPDNILISCEDPFTVKLSDFGLSKVVKNEDTFLKTFCGTLLYCAPEVFPHYDAHVVKQGTKRRRTGGAPQSHFHSYSQSVDIWSFAAVLWFALCGKPPFEGVIDATGKGMFHKIMETRLDTSPLKARNISEECTDVLLQMLNTDPSARPTEKQCLENRWLSDGIQSTHINDDSELNPIPEEEEEDVEEVEPEFSQLSIHERSRESSIYGEDGEEVSFSSGDFDFLDTRQSKRIRPDLLVPRNQPRDQADIDSSPEVSYSELSHMQHPDDSYVLPRPSTRPNRLFGEIGRSALESSGVLGAHTGHALSMGQTGPSDVPTSADTSAPGVVEGNTTDEHNIHHNEGEDYLPNTEQPLYEEGEDGAAASLLGAESLVRELNMASPHSINSPPDEPATPRTPHSPHNPSIGHDGVADGQHNPPEEVTPKAPSFSRQITLNIPPSLYYDPQDPSTHNLEYASRVSGRDYVAEAAAADGKLLSLPATISMSTNRDSHQAAEDMVAIPHADTSGFRRPPPHLGKLTSTEDSFERITLRLDKRFVTWGRDPTNTIVYKDKMDTRIPKQAISIWFHAVDKDIEKAERDNVDWTKMDGLFTIVKTYSRVGILVNDVRLRHQDKEGRNLFGRIYSGDVITVFDEGRDGARLKFLCEFYHGAAVNKRAAGSRFEIQKTDRDRSVRTSSTL